jgi:undecaprenyl-diphosphatase
MALGTFLADAIHFPIPPQFYLLAAIAAGGPQSAPVLAICLGSLAGAVVALALGRYLARVPRVGNWLSGSKPWVDSLVHRHGPLAILLAGLSPIPFSTQCNVAGMYRLPARFIVALFVLRVPRILLFHTAIRMGWNY